MKHSIRILYVNGGLMNRGGIESYMMNYYRHFNHDEIQIDFIVHNAGGYGYYDKEIKALGGQIFVLPKKSKYPLSYTAKLKKILKKGNYKIIHTHMDAMGAWVLKTAKDCGIPIRIAHSHNTQHLTTNPIKLFFLEQARQSINRYATHRIACSNIAGKWLFGNQPFQIVRNAIDIEKFKYNEKTRNQIRKEYNIENNFLIGHVGRFDKQKNHIFLINVFAEVHKIFPNSKLMLIGEGYLKESIQKKIDTLNLRECIILTGVRNDANLFYNAFDLFVLPSLFEGLGIVAIESEMNGCTTFLSDQVPIEAKIAPNVHYIPLKKKLWTQQILSFIYSKEKREEAHFNLQASGYDIKTEAQKLQEIYIDLWNKN